VPKTEGTKTISDTSGHRSNMLMVAVDCKV